MLEHLSEAGEYEAAANYIRQVSAEERIDL